MAGNQNDDDRADAMFKTEAVVYAPMLNSEVAFSKKIDS